MLEVWVSGLVGESVKLFFPWAGEVVVSFDWARDVVGCVRRSVSCAGTLVCVTWYFKFVIGYLSPDIVGFYKQLDICNLILPKNLLENSNLAPCCTSRNFSVTPPHIFLLYILLYLYKPVYLSHVSWKLLTNFICKITWITFSGLEIIRTNMTAMKQKINTS